MEDILKGSNGPPNCFVFLNFYDAGKTHRLNIGEARSSHQASYVINQNLPPEQTKGSTTVMSVQHSRSSHKENLLLTITLPAQLLISLAYTLRRNKHSSLNQPLQAEWCAELLLQVSEKEFTSPLLGTCDQCLQVLLQIINLVLCLSNLIPSHAMILHTEDDTPTLGSEDIEVDENEFGIPDAVHTACMCALQDSEFLLGVEVVDFLVGLAERYIVENWLESGLELLDLESHGAAR